MECCCEITFRGIVGSGRGDTEEIEMLGSKLRRQQNGLELETCGNPRLKLLNDLGMSEDSKALSCLVVQDKGKLSATRKRQNSEEGLP